jgi:phosphatidylinositol glycan class A protein
LNDIAGLNLSAAQNLIINTSVGFNICVSYVTGANVMLRNGQKEDKIRIVENAVDCEAFYPVPESRYDGDDGDDDSITIAIISRLCYRKGTDLLYNLLPSILAKHSNVNVVVAGDGNKLILLTEMIERYTLQDKVKLLGSVDTSSIPGILQKSDIMLNTSLTESFCIAILEGACCGNVIVSSDVGGVREVFSGSVIEDDGGVIYSDVDCNSMICAVDCAIGQVNEMRKSKGGVDGVKQRWHDDLAERYTWDNVAAKVEGIYYETMASHRKREMRDFVLAWAEGRTIIAGWAAIMFGLFVMSWIRLVDRFSSEVELSWNAKEWLRRGEEDTKRKKKKMKNLKVEKVE